jgi:membrane protein
MWFLLRDTARQWSEHRTARLGAALAYYSVFSLGPLMVIAISIAGLVFGHAAVRGEVSAEIAALLGDTGAKAVESMLAAASRPFEGVIATVIGLGVLLFAALGVVVQLKDALNTVWDAEPPQGSGIWGFVRTYLVSLAAIGALGFLLLVSLVATAVLAATGKYVSAYVPEATLQLVNGAVSFAVTTVLFAMMFKWLPDTHVAWRDVWLGAAVTAVLFNVGKLLIGLYIGKQGLESVYGAAASIVVLLLWVYYSAQILLLGAEFTHVYAQHHGSRRPLAPSASDPVRRPA